MKLLFSGDMAPTGFGTVTMDLGRALLDLGVDVRFLSQNDVGTLPEPFLSRTLEAATFVTGAQGVEDVSAAIPDLLGGHSVALLANGEPYGDWKPDAVFLLGDFAAVRFTFGPYADAFRKVPTFHYCPVEGVDLPPSWKDVWSDINPIAMSRFGQAEMAKVIGYVPPMMYHGVDAETFHPVSPSDPIVIKGDGVPDVTLTSKLACRQFFTDGAVDPRKVWVLRTDRHMPRKGYNLLLRAMAPVLERHPEVDLILHCQQKDQGGYLPDTISKLPESIHEQVILTSMAGIPRPVLCALYNAADIYVSPSAEGFGLTIAEAIACGVPAVGLRYSAVPEVIGPAGQTVPVGHLEDNPYDHFWAFPDPALFGKAVEWMVTHQSRRRELGALGPAHVRKWFDWRKSAEQLIDIMSPKAMEVAA